MEYEEPVADEEREKTNLEMDERNNSHCNTTEQMVFDEEEIHFQEQEDPLKRVNEITTDGKGEMMIEFYEDGRTVISSDNPCTLKRICWNRLNVNYAPVVCIYGSSEEMKIHDKHFSLESEKRATKKISSGLSPDSLAEEKFKFLEEYVGWKYGDNTKKRGEWTVRGVHIAFINKRNTGRLTITNKSLQERSVRTQKGRILLNPFDSFHFD